MDPDWLRWAKHLQAISQTGLHFSENVYDIQRYKEIRDISAEILSMYGGVDKAFILNLFDGQYGYATPKVDVRGVVFEDSELLLVREILDNNRWTVPGGWADVNESPKEAVEREVFEESGFRTRVVKLLAVYDRTLQGHAPPLPFHVYKLFFLCEIVDGEATPSVETSEIGFFPEGQMPELSTSRVTRKQIHRFFDHYRHPAWPTDFD